MAGLFTQNHDILVYFIKSSQAYSLSYLRFELHCFIFRFLIASLILYHDFLPFKLGSLRYFQGHVTFNILNYSVNEGLSYFIYEFFFIMAKHYNTMFLDLGVWPTFYMPAFKDLGLLCYTSVVRPSILLHITLSSQLVLNHVGDFNETWYKERPHCVDVHFVREPCPIILKEVTAP
jgi:hypothetical protein